MVNSSQTFKTGEMAPETGSYGCLLCRGRDRTTVVSLTRGTIIPFCEVCGEKDVTWRRVEKE